MPNSKYRPTMTTQASGKNRSNSIKWYLGRFANEFLKLSTSQAKVQQVSLSQRLMRYPI
jgi:hypothetical protein